MSTARKATTYLPLFPYLGTQPGSIEAEGELIVVNFAGIGGACKGLEAALRRPVDHAINHDPVVLNLHRRNMPHTTHHVQDVWQVDPADLTRGRKIAVAWFSPDCTHFSSAKGGQPRQQNIRDLAWVTTKYTALPAHERPRVIFLENVKEFADWGPLDDRGQPIKARKGETFREFVATIESHGYEVQHRLLRACDYGAPTTRLRLFMVARCDDQPIRFPEPTHGDPKSEAVKSGRLLPWRTAAEIIDWDIPMQSVFGRSDPLVENTMRRVARGLGKYVKDDPDPYIAPVDMEVIAPVMINKQFDSPARSLRAPVTTNHNKNELAAALLVKSGHYSNRTGEGSHFRGQRLNTPLSTVTASGNHPMLTVAHLTKFRPGSTGSSLNEPLHTVTAGGHPARPSTGNVHGLVAATLVQFYGLKTASDIRAQALGTPLKTQTTENRHALVTASLVKHYGGYYNGAGIPMNRPLDAITAVDHHALLSAYLIKIDQQGFLKGSAAYRLTEPVTTVTTKAAHALTSAYLIQYNGQNDAVTLGNPLNTLTTRDRFGLGAAFLVREFGESDACSAVQPTPTIMPDGGGKTRVAVAALAPAPIGKAREVYELMRKWMPECLTEKDHTYGMVFVTVNGVEYIIADVFMRMLDPRELARGQSFDDSYVLHEDANGKKVTKTAQVRGIGNSVCPILAQRLAEANLTLREAAD